MPRGLKKTRRLNLHATITMLKIDNTISTILTHTAPPAPSEEYTKLLSGGEGIIRLQLPTLAGLNVEEEEGLLLLLCKMNVCTAKDKQI